MIFDPSEIRALIRVATKRTGTPIHDEDLEQDVALHAVEAFQRLNDVMHPRALLMKIVCDAVRDHWRRRRSPEDLDDIDERFISHMPAFETDVDHERRLEFLRLALARLPKSKRVVLEMFYLGDYSISEIAALQCRSVSAVKMDLARSRRSLADLYSRIAKQKKCRRNR